MITTETTVTSIVGPYTGTRISGTSEDVAEAILTVEYHFDGFSVHVADIPARLDRATGKHYLAGPIAIRINTKVNEIMGMMERDHRPGPESTQDETPRTFRLNAADFVSDAA